MLLLMLPLLLLPDIGLWPWVADASFECNVNMLGLAGEPLPQGVGAVAGIASLAADSVTCHTRFMAPRTGLGFSFCLLPFQVNTPHTFP